MREFELKLPNETTLDGLDQIVNSDAEPSVRAMAAVVRDLADATIVMSEIITAPNSRVKITRSTDPIAGESSS